MTNERRLSIRLTVVLSLSGMLLLVLVGASSSVSIAKADGITMQEASLAPTGIAYEINPDTHGNLWISDLVANQIWQVHPATRVVTIYSGLPNPSDARRDAAGGVWWTNANNTELGRISLGASTVTIWTLPGTGNLWGIAFDAAGRVWTTNFIDGMVYRFTPDTTEVCTYDVPDAGASDYILAQGADIWLGDKWNNRILKLDPGSNVFTLWQIAGAAIPKGMTMEANGNLWWADENRPMLARLEPSISRMTAYTLPVGAQPEMIALNQGKVWYTESVSRTVGVLNPTIASGVTSTLVKTTAPVTPTCSNLGVGTSSAVAFSTQTLNWLPSSYIRTVNSADWAVYQLPSGASPWGIAASGNDVWFVDQGRRKLAHLDLAAHVYLPIIKR